jgi:hypothetical protein
MKRARPKHRDGHPEYLQSRNSEDASVYSCCVQRHFARVAHGNEHMANLEKIENAIGMRWIAAHAQHAHSMSTVSGSISNMFDRNQSGSANLPLLHPEAFLASNESPPYPEEIVSSCWSELMSLDSVPSIDDDKAFLIFVSLVDVRVRKDGTTWKLLKTSHIVR